MNTILIQMYAGYPYQCQLIFNNKKHRKYMLCTYQEAVNWVRAIKNNRNKWIIIPKISDAGDVVISAYRHMPEF